MKYLANHLPFEAFRKARSGKHTWPHKALAFKIKYLKSKKYRRKSNRVQYSVSKPYCISAKINNETYFIVWLMKVGITFQASEHFSKIKHLRFHSLKLLFHLTSDRSKLCLWKDMILLCLEPGNVKAGYLVMFSLGAIYSRNKHAYPSKALPKSPKTRENMI